MRSHHRYLGLRKWNFQKDLSLGHTTEDLRCHLIYSGDPYQILMPLRDNICVSLENTFDVSQ